MIPDNNNYFIEFEQLSVYIILLLFYVMLFELL